MDILNIVVLSLTLVVIIWYTIETKKLREWQTKQVQLTILNLEFNRVYENAKQPHIRIPFSEDWPIIVRKIYEKGELDTKTFYSKSYHKDL